MQSLRRGPETPHGTFNRSLNLPSTQRYRVRSLATNGYAVARGQ
jgi:hypothetical protein